jgi:hypothetical protein
MHPVFSLFEERLKEREPGHEAEVRDRLVEPRHERDVRGGEPDATFG